MMILLTYLGALVLIALIGLGVWVLLKALFTDIAKDPLF